MNNRDAVIVEALRTPVGKMGQSLAGVPAPELGAAVIRQILERTKVKPAEVDEVVFGNLFNYDWANFSRVACLTAGLPVEVPAVTLDRQCSSSLNAVAYAAMMIQTGNADIVIAGGVESYSQQPGMIKRPERAYPPSLELIPGVKPSIESVGNPPMIKTADTLAEMYGLTRQECDAFACESHRKAAAAWEAGLFQDQVIDFEVKGKKGSTIVKMDDCVRADCKIEDLAKLKPIMGGVTTAGNSSPMNDGGSAVLVMSYEKAKEMGFEVLARVSAFAAAGVDPNIMGIGPVPAIRKLMKKTGDTIDDFDLIELNEAFAAQSLACIKELGINMEKCNVNGGAIAIGHPNAASGGILVARIVHEMKRRDAKKGLVSFCIGGGQGFAVLFERE